MLNQTRILFITSLIFCSITWAYRLYALFKTAAIGELQDFRIYYIASRTILEGNPNPEIIVKSSFGPPFTIFGFMPFTFFSLYTDQILITAINIICFFITFYLLWTRWYGAKNAFFWFFLGLIAFCFPVIFSLGMGNPIGVVTLGIYIFWITKNKFIQWFLYSFSIILKLFPLVILPLILISWNKKSLQLNQPHIKNGLLAGGIVAVLSLTLLPFDVWNIYIHYSTEIRTFTMPDSVVYNQSFSSTLARFGLSVSSFSILYWVFVAILGAGILYYLSIHKQRIFEFNASLHAAILLLCVALLIHPFPWQHYFAIFIPFLMLKIKKLSLIPIIIFIFLCIDGGKIYAPGFIGAFLSSSQFIATVLLYVYLLKTKNQPS